MRAYHEKGYRVAILTNEVDIGRFKNRDPVLRAVNRKISRLETFVKHVDIPVEVLVATGYDDFRKQSTKDRRKNPPVGGIGFWKFLKTDHTGYGFEEQPVEEHSFFVGMEMVVLKPKYMHTYIKTYRRTYIYKYTYMHTYRHTDVQTYRHTDIHTYIHAYIHIYIYTCIYRHTDRQA